MLEVHKWQGEGYKPLVFHDGWQVALLNWEPLFDRRNLDEIEQHNQTDEVFVLVKGRAVLFTHTEDGDFEVADMIPGVVYNVPAGVWHNLVATQDAVFLIVEDRDTHLHDTEIRPITTTELHMLDAQLPDWAV